MPAEDKTADEDTYGSWDFWRGVLVGVLGTVGVLMVFALGAEVRDFIHGKL